MRCKLCNGYVERIGQEVIVHQPCTTCTKRLIRECKIDNHIDYWKGKE